MAKSPVCSRRVFVEIVFSEIISLCLQRIDDTV